MLHHIDIRDLFGITISIQTVTVDIKSLLSPAEGSAQLQPLTRSQSLNDVDSVIGRAEAAPAGSTERRQSQSGSTGTTLLCVVLFDEKRDQTRRS